MGSEIWHAWDLHNLPDEELLVTLAVAEDAVEKGNEKQRLIWDARARMLSAELGRRDAGESPHAIADAFDLSGLSHKTLSAAIAAFSSQTVDRAEAGRTALADLDFATLRLLQHEEGRRIKMRQGLDELAERTQTRLERQCRGEVL